MPKIAAKKTKGRGPSGAAETTRRKDEHLRITLGQAVNSIEDAGWDGLHLEHRANPDIDYSDIRTESDFFGHYLAAPFLISSMTAGTPAADALNIRLAKFAEAKQIPMGLGSLRVAIEHRHADPTGKLSGKNSVAQNIFRVRQQAPKATLLANLGLVQLNYGVTPDDCAWLIENLQAQALIFHLNPLQEAIQLEGNRNFKGLFEKISAIKKAVKIPLILKETGCGLDSVTIKKAIDVGFDAIDVAGLGGTHWGFIEGLRSPQRRSLGTIYRDWGIPTVEALVNARRIAGPDFPIIASGGIRHGLDAAKAVALGAHTVGLALPFLRAAQAGNPELERFYAELLESFKIAMFCTGRLHCASLRASLTL